MASRDVMRTRNAFNHWHDWEILEYLELARKMLRQADETTFASRAVVVGIVRSILAFRAKGSPD